MTVRRGVKLLSIGLAGLLVTAILLTAGFAAYNRWNLPGHIYPWAEPESYDHILALAQRGEAAKALNAVQDIKFDVHGSVREPAMRDVVGILVERGQIREVREFALQLRDHLDGNSFLLELVEIQAETGDVDGALETVGLVVADHDIRVGLGRIAVTTARLGNFSRALAVARSIEPAGGRIYSLTQIGVILANKGEPVAGREIVEESLTIARSITDERSRRWAIAEIAIAMARLGDWQFASELAATANPKDQGAYALAELAQIQFEAGDLKAARDTARGIANVHYRNDAVEKIMRPQLANGDLAEALKTATTIPSGAERDKFLFGIAIYIPYLSNSHTTSFGVLDTALAVADAVEDNALRDGAYHCLATYAASEIDIIGALRTLLLIEDSKNRENAIGRSYESLLYGYGDCTPIS